MAASSLSAASLCTRSCIRVPQWQSHGFVRSVSTTSAINRGIRASRNSPSDRDRRPGLAGPSRDSFSRGPDAFSRSRDDTRNSGQSERQGGRSRDRRETRRDQRRNDRRDGEKGQENKSSPWKGMVDLKSHTAPRDAWKGMSDVKAPAASRDAKNSRPSRGSQRVDPVDKKSRFENEGVRAYGDNTGFFSRGTRSKRFDADKPAMRRSEQSAFRSPDRSSRGSRTPDFKERSVRDEGTSTGESAGRRSRNTRDGRTGTPDFNRRPTRDEGASTVEASDRGSRFTRDGGKPSSQPEYKNLTHDNNRDTVPVTVPYSSAASQWLYGVNTVMGALRGKNRKTYQLIIKKGEKSAEVDQIVRLARKAEIGIQTHDDTRLLDKLSDGRPHNGVVLEVSALPARPVAHMKKPQAETSNIPLELFKQNAEEAAINGTSETLRYNSKSWRQPLVLFLDGILDPGNLGGILRTAHFYGVDAVAVAARTCASLNSPILAKASAGACEAIPIFAVTKAADFIAKSGLAGWRICAAVAPGINRKLSKQATTASLALTSPLARKPCILMMGSEGEGLRDNLLSKADLEVTIERGAPSIDVGVDSMNVSVATGVLVDAFMRQPLTSASSTASNSSNRVF